MSKTRFWYLVYTKPRAEIQANDNLVRQDYETNLPLVQKQGSCNGRYTKQTKTFFPRYLFIHLDCRTDNWAPIRSTIGIAGIIRFGGLPAAVPDSLIVSLKINEDNSGIQKMPQ